MPWELGIGVGHRDRPGCFVFVVVVLVIEIFLSCGFVSRFSQVDI